MFAWFLFTFENNQLILIGGKDIAFAKYGPAWRLHRKVFATALRQHLSDQPLIGRTIDEQTLGILKYLDKQKEDSFDPMLIVTTAVANVICAITFGEGFDNNHPGSANSSQLTSAIWKISICKKWMGTWITSQLSASFPLSHIWDFDKTPQTFIVLLGRCLERQRQSFSKESPRARWFLGC